MASRVVCQYCGQNFPPQFDLAAHEAQHQNNFDNRVDLWHYCQICGSKFNSAFSLYDHQLRHGLGEGRQRDGTYQYREVGRQELFNGDAELRRSTPERQLEEERTDCFTEEQRRLRDEALARRRAAAKEERVRQEHLARELYNQALRNDMSYDIWMEQQRRG